VARKIFGKISVENQKPPGTKLRVVAWDADIDADDHMGLAEVAEDGSYAIQYKDDNWDWSPTKAVTKWRPDVYISVEWFDPLGAFWRPVSRSKTYSDQDVRDDREIDLSVTIPNTTAQTVYGRITDVNGNPLVGLTVTAWDDDPSAQRAVEAQGGEPPKADAKGEIAQFMGSAVTDENGEYSIRYSGNLWDEAPHWTVRAGMGAWWRPDIFIKVQREGTGVLYRSPTHENVLQGTGVYINAKIEEGWPPHPPYFLKSSLNIVSHAYASSSLLRNPYNPTPDRYDPEGKPGVSETVTMVSRLLEAASRFLVGEDEVLSVEQPVTYEYGRDRMVVVEYLGFFVLPRERYEDLDAWIHEFIEKTLTEEVTELDGVHDYAISFSDRCVSIFHVLTGLTTGSGWDDEELTPDQFWEKIHAGI